MLFQDLTLSGASVAPTSSVRASTMLLLPGKLDKMYEVQVASSGITFIPSLMKVGLLVHGNVM
jgi:hypothetical protein